MLLVLGAMDFQTVPDETMKKIVPKTEHARKVLKDVACQRCALQKLSTAMGSVIVLMVKTKLLVFHRIPHSVRHLHQKAQLEVGIINYPLI